MTVPAAELTLALSGLQKERAGDGDLVASFQTRGDLDHVARDDYSPWHG